MARIAGDCGGGLDGYTGGISPEDEEILERISVDKAIINQIEQDGSREALREAQLKYIRDWGGHDGKQFSAFI